jgi:hypothetical protein
MRYPATGYNSAFSKIICYKDKKLKSIKQGFTPPILGFEEHRLNRHSQTFLVCLGNDMLKF